MHTMVLYRTMIEVAAEDDIYRVELTESGTGILADT